MLRETSLSVESEDPLSKPLWYKNPEKGSLVMLISPSDGIEPDTDLSWSSTTWGDIDYAQKRIESWGLRVERRLNEAVTGFAAGTPEERRENLRRAIRRNPDVIWMVKGGYAIGDVISVAKEPWVMKWLRYKKPMIIGYSDSSWLEGEIFQNTGLITVSGIHAGGLGGRTDTWNEKTIELIHQVMFGKSMDILSGDGWRVIQRGSGEVSNATFLPMNIEAGSRVRWKIPGDKILAIEDDYDFWSDARRALTALWNNLGEQDIKGVILGSFSDMRHDGEDYPQWSRGMTPWKLVREVMGDRPEVLVAEYKHFGHPHEGTGSQFCPMPVGSRACFGVGDKDSDRAFLHFLK